MSDTSNIQVPHIISNSIVSISLNTSQINGLYQLYQFLLDSLGAANVESLKVKFESRLPLTSLEMSLISAIQILQLVNKSAMDNNQVEYKPLDHTINQALSA